jgi:hypothetical protein
MKLNKKIFMFFGLIILILIVIIFLGEYFKEIIYLKISLYNQRCNVNYHNWESAKTMVVLIFGQSNSANYGEVKYSVDGNVYNFYKGDLYKVADPLFGASGKNGSIWCLLANKLIKENVFENIVLISISEGNSKVSDWSNNGKFFTKLDNVISEVAKFPFEITHIFWHQGEADNFENTSSVSYQRSFKKLINYFESKVVSASIFVSIATYHPLVKNKQRGVNLDLQQAQKQIIDDYENVFLGVNSDNLISAFDRYDGIHFSESAQKEMALEWYKNLINANKGK